MSINNRKRDNDKISFEIIVKIILILALIGCGIIACLWMGWF